MNTHVDHALLTRFNLPSPGHERIVRAKDNWLRDRVALFERYCLPSVQAQTSRNFCWLVYFDPHSPPWLLEWVAHHETAGHFRPHFRDQVPRAILLDDIHAATGGRCGDLLTTNLDNDDAIACDFVSRVQGMQSQEARTALYIGYGLIVRDQRLYRRLDPHNAFCSVRESWTDPVTCWSDWHDRLPTHMPTVVLRDGPGWLQVVHGGNVSNRVNGRRVGPSAYRAAFPGTLDGLTDPKRSELARDALLVSPSRLLREAGRGTVKWAISQVMGTDGLDRAKLLWASAMRLTRIRR